MAELQVVVDVLAAQEERARAYAGFHALYEKYLRTGDAALFADECAGVTKRFQEVSARMRAAEAALKRAGRDEEAGMVRRLQELEQGKLQLTATRQSMGAKFVLELRRPHDPEYVRDDRELRGAMAAVVDDIVDVVEELRYAAQDMRGE